MTNATVAVLQDIFNSTITGVATLLPAADAINLTNVVAAAGAVCIAASAITALTPTPDPSTKLGKLYKIIELLALVVGKAKR
jgi:hypothetical protein